MGEGPLGWILLVLLGVGRGVPLEADLDRVGAEQVLASIAPAVYGVNQVGAEQL